VWVQFIRFRSHIGVSPYLTSLLAMGVLTSAVSRGADYIAIDDKLPQSLTFVERSMPLDWWGTVLVLAGLVAGVAWLRSWWGLVIIGHSVLAITFVMFGVGSLVAVTGDAWVGSGWRTGVGYIVGAGTTHIVLALTARHEWDRERARRQALERLAAGEER